MYQDILASSSSDLAALSPVITLQLPVWRASAAQQKQAQDKLCYHPVAPGHPLFIVKKKDGSVQFCVDYHQLNDVTQKRIPDSS